MIRRTILKTKDGKVIVRPKAGYGRVQVCENIVAQLTEEGKKAWDAGEELSVKAGHFTHFADTRGIARADFFIERLQHIKRTHEKG